MIDGIIGVGCLRANRSMIMMMTVITTPAIPIIIQFSTVGISNGLTGIVVIAVVGIVVVATGAVVGVVVTTVVITVVRVVARAVVTDAPAPGPAMVVVAAVVVVVMEVVTLPGKMISPVKGPPVFNGVSGVSDKGTAYTT